MFPVEPVVLPPCFLLHGTHGCNRHPAFPAPSTFSKGKVDANLRRIAPRECGGTSFRSARGVSSPLPLAGEGAEQKRGGRGLVPPIPLWTEAPTPASPPHGRQ